MSDLASVCARHVIWWNPYRERVAMTLDWTGKLLERYSDDEREAVCDVLKAKYGIVTERSGKEWRSNGCTVAGDYHYEHAPTELDAVIALADWMRS